MATYIDLDSTYRDTDNYPNPANYIISARQVSTWPAGPRTVTAVSTPFSGRELDFVQSVKVLALSLPYANVTYTDNTGAIIATHTADIRRVYLDVYSMMYNDSFLIYTIDNKISKAKFVLMQAKIQYDSASNPIAVIFTTQMNQVMRFARNGPITIRMMQELGYIINIPDTFPITPSLQTWLNLELTPYFQDAEYDNHGLNFIDTRY